MGITTAVFPEHENIYALAKQLFKSQIFFDLKCTPVSGSFEMLEKLSQAKFSLYALTDNTLEIVAYLKARYDF